MKLIIDTYIRWLAITVVGIRFLDLTGFQNLLGLIHLAIFFRNHCLSFSLAFVLLKKLPLLICSRASDIARFWSWFRT